MPDWVEIILLSVAWAPVLVLIHELGHALAALALTDGDVSIDIRHAGLSGGSVMFEPERVRSIGGLITIVAAGPAASLAAAAVLVLVWLGDDRPVWMWESGVVSTGALMATITFLATALPLRYGAGLGGRGESDGRVIWRILTEARRARSRATERAGPSSGCSRRWGCWPWRWTRRSPSGSGRCSASHT